MTRTRGMFLGAAALSFSCFDAATVSKFDAVAKVAVRHGDLGMSKAAQDTTTTQEEERTKGKEDAKELSAEEAQSARIKILEEENSPSSFPTKMMEILSDETNCDIICWLDHGKGFMIRNKKRFAGEILPKYFNKNSKFTSFTRKLNRWSFTRVTRGPETGAYYHPHFQKDNPSMSMQMSCINSKSSQQIQPMNPIALGLGMPNNFQPPYDESATMQQRQMFYQQCQQQQQQFMTMWQQQQQQQKEGKKEGGEGEDISESKQDGPMMAAQQQYYSMLMAQQQHMAMMAGQHGQVMAPMQLPPGMQPAESAGDKAQDEQPNEQIQETSI
jgi:hypothetical protein